jgi:PEGA domain
MIQRISTTAVSLWMILAAVGCSVNPTAVTTDPSGAFVSVNNVGAGTSPLNYTFDFGKQPVYEVKASKPGYFDSTISLNSSGVGITNGVLSLALQQDDAYNVTTTTDATNRWLRVEISPKITQADAWQKIVDTVTDRFPSIEQMDPSSGYLRSVTISHTFKHPEFGEHTIRTQFTGTISSRDPLVYKMMIVAQESTTAGSWVAYDRVFKEDAQMIEELQSRLGTK